MSSHSVVGMTDELKLTWERFRGGADVDLHALRPVIAASWSRCQAFQLDPGITAAPKLLSASEIEHRKIQSGIYSAARHVVPVASECIREGDYCVIMVIDPECMTLEVQGDLDGLRSAEDAGAVPGSRWSENDTGTDALSLCVRLESAVWVSDYEHYCKVGHGCTGAAAPIHAPLNGPLFGALGIYKQGIWSPTRS